MRFTIDAAFCDKDLRVRKTMTLPPNRLSLPRWSIKAVVEAEAGSFERWGLTEGVQLATTRHDPTAD
jgi:hypothetical protein